MVKEFTIVIDIAKKTDYTGIQIYRKVPYVNEGNKLLEQHPILRNKYDIVSQFKFQGNTYTNLVDNICKLVRVNDFNGVDRHDLIVDGTGVGEVVVDLMRSKGLNPIPIIFTSGNTANKVYAPYSEVFDKTSRNQFKVLKQINVPKKDLVDSAITCLEQKLIRLAPNINYKEDFINQLENFKGKINEKNNIKYEAATQSIHDDFVACFLMYSWWLKYQDPQMEEEINEVDYPFDKLENSLDNINLFK